jgi:transposase
MTVLAEPLPNDPEALKALLLAERAKTERLTQIIKELQRHRFGRRAESLPIDQLELGLEDVQQIEAETMAAAEAVDPERRSARAARRRANGCAGVLHRIGEDVAKRLDVIPAQFRVLVVRRPKYACRACQEVVVQAPAPARLIEGGLPTEATVAHVVVAKYADHLPLYRQAQIYGRQGIALDRSTLADWTGRAAFLLRPLHARLLEKLKASPKLFADETTAPVLDPGRGRTKTGQLWAYARDDRPWGGLDPPGAAYVYAPDRTAERPIQHLAGFSGVLQVDGYGGYRKLASTNAVTLAFCWAHVRRKFYELAASGPAPIATEALERIAALYAIEADIRGRPADERRAERQAKSRPIILALEPWLRARLETLSQKSKLAEAIRYALGRWEGLTRFLDDGRVEIDSNIVERAIRPIATTESLCIPSSSVCKHWNLIFWFEVTRAAFTPHRSKNVLALKVGGPDLVGRASDDLLRRQNAGLDQLADAMARDAALLRSVSQGQPGPVLIGREIGVDTSDAPDRSDAVRGPGLALARRQSQAVQSGGDVLIRPAGRHAADDGQGVLWGATVVTARLRLAEPEFGMLSTLPMDDENDLPRLFIDVGGDLVHQRSQQLLASAHGDAGRLTRGLEIIGQARKIRRRRRRDGLRRCGQPRLAILNAA